MKYLNKNTDYTLLLDNIILNISTDLEIEILSRYIPYKMINLYIIKKPSNINKDELQISDYEINIKVKSTNGTKNIIFIPESATIFDIYPIQINNININNLFDNGLSLSITDEFSNINIKFNKFISNIGAIIKW